MPPGEGWTRREDLATILINKENIHTYLSRFIPERIAEISPIFFQDTYILPNLLALKSTADVTGGKSIAV
jgi:hypothetical protein